MKAIDLSALGLLLRGLLLPFWFSAAVVAAPGATDQDSSSARSALSRYFQSECDLVARQCLEDIRSLKDWEQRRGEYQRQLREMLGLWPMPERTDLRAEITGTLEHAEFTVERLHFQASPGLYVTGNLYLPRGLQAPAPTILYVCGHSRVITNSVSCGNKAGYQHHGAWFARHGYVCLLIDTVQLGEIQGEHHGTYTQNQWWWNARGYTPAGAEAWFGIRALDYLCSRPEVDATRIGMTGRSGGGAYTWTVAALDDRVRVAAPVAGITDLRNYVVDGAVEGHCDCMFFVNTYRWDYPQLAALLAPRPLLLGNSDKDKIFPLDGVLRLHEKVRRIYSLYGAATNLGLLITEGPHADTQDLQVPVFRWFNRFLKGEQPPIERAAAKLFAPARLRVFERVPEDQINTRIQERFVARAKLAGDNPTEGRRDQLLAQLREQVFHGWPETSMPPGLRLVNSLREEGVALNSYEFASQQEVVCKLHVLCDAVREPGACLLTVLDPVSYTNSPARGLWLGDGAREAMREMKTQVQGGKAALAFLAPRLVEFPRLTADSDRKAIHIRRRYMLLGQTLDAMRVWDIRAGFAALRSLPQTSNKPVTLQAQGNMGVNALYAALFEPDIASLRVSGIPAAHDLGPDYLNILKFTDISEVLKLLDSRLD